MRVVFMGTPDFAVRSLDKILEAGYEVPLVVSTPDRPKGRGQKMIPSAVKAFAQEKGLRVATPERLKDSDFLEELRSSNPDVICVVAFRILPEAVYSIPPQGSFNLHGSLLPRYRGAAPINRAIMNGEGETGVTTFFLKKHVDTGDIILTCQIPITQNMTAGELHDVMMETGAETVIETLQRIESGNVQTVRQDDRMATPAPKIFREDCLIDWNKPADYLHNFIRGLSPYPAAYTTWQGKVLKIYQTELSAMNDLAPGEVIATKDTLRIGTGTRSLNITELQQEGKRAMGIEEFLRGNQFTEREQVG